MPMKTQYYTVDGVILGERTNGQTVAYLPDALGSVAGTAGTSGNLQRQFRYKPFGETLYDNGTGVKPKKRWVGTLGYRSTGMLRSEYYVRARHYGTQEGQWTTIDRHWPGEPSHIYVRCSPVRFTDPSGEKIADLFKEFCGYDPCPDYSRCSIGSDCHRTVLRCMADAGFGKPDDVERIRKALVFILESCTDSGPTICGVRDNRGPRPDNYPPECPWPPCQGFESGWAWPLLPPVAQTPPAGESLCKISKDPCSEALRQLGCGCLVAICPMAELNAPAVFCQQTLLHELIHCAGFQGAPGHNVFPGTPHDFVYKLGCCLCKALYPEGGKCGSC
jgi:RHS repeat-associated protein